MFEMRQNQNSFSNVIRAVVYSVLFGAVFLSVSSASSVFAQSNGEYSLSLSDSSVEVGDTVEVDYETPDGTDNNSDWIALYQQGEGNREYIEYEYTSEETSGTVTFTLEESGEYQFRYLKNNAYTSVETSNTLTVIETNNDDNDNDNDTDEDTDEDTDTDNGNNEDDDQQNSGEYSVSLSDTSVSVDETVTVDFEAPTGVNRRSDWIAVYESGASNRDYEEYEYTDEQTSGSVSFTIDEPGDYEFRYLKNNGYTSVATSETLTVTENGGDDDDDGNEDDDEDDNGDGGGTNGDYSLSLSETSVSVDETVTVNYQAPSNTDNDRDWIAVYESGASNRDYEDYEYTNEDSSGSVTFTIDEPREYEFRYLKNNGYTSVEESEELTVEPDTDEDNDNDNGNNEDDDQQNSGEYSVSLSDTSVSVDETVTVDFEAPTGVNRRSDWIAVYESGASNRDYEEYEYTDEQTSGSVSFTIDEPGDYEFRYLKNNGYTSVATSETLTVTENGGDDDDDGNEDEDSGNDGNDEDENNDDDEDEDGDGEYSLSIANDNYEVGEDIEVDWQVASSDRNLDNFIGLYRPGDDDNEYIDFKYTFSIFDNGDRTFEVDAPGTYEFRLFLDNRYDKVATSQTFTVGDAVGGGQCPVSESELDDVTNYPAGDGPVIAFGDSLTEGVGASTGQDYVSELERLTDMEITNAGVSGDTTADALDRLESDVLSEDPSTVIVWLGGNDILRRAFRDAENNLDDEGRERLRELILENDGTIPDGPVISQEETFDNLREIVDRIQVNGAVVVLVGFNTGIYNSDLQDDYEDLAADTGSLYVENALRGVVGRPSLMADLVHPNNAGYDIVASRIEPAFSCAVQ